MASFQLLNADVLARLKPFGILFEKSLNDLIKGIRAHAKDSPESLATFLDGAIAECQTELKSTDLETKAMAVLKLCYLEMYGFDMSSCNFQILEVMSSSKFQQKRIGYLAAIQSFKNEKDLLILATNQFKKDLNSHNHVEIGLALSGIATIVTPNLSKDINDDVLMKLNHSKPYIRKKAILAMYKIFLQYPESLRINFNRIIEKLDDTDISVVSATVNVICEISKKNPNIFVNYLPKFFTILEETKNNWLIIRILKLFQSLSKVEPRMKKKIMPTLLDLMLRTQASSLIYECINCIVNGNMLSEDSSKDKETARICIKQLMEFFQTRDSNLKFVGLLALINILKIFPDLIANMDGVSNVVMECLTENDIIIQRKALEISHYLVNEDNITEVVKVLLLQLVPTEKTVPESLKQDVALKIISIASQDNYTNIPNFKWYVAVLKDIINLTLLPISADANVVTISHNTANTIASEIGKEFKNLTTKVPSIRLTVLTKVVIPLGQDIRILEHCPILLRDLYWILGEYVDEIQSTQQNGDDSEEDDDDDFENGGNTSGGLGTKIQIFNNTVNFKIDKLMNVSEDRQFPISHALINLSVSEVLAILIPALVKLFSGIVNDYLQVYSINDALPQEKVNELMYYLYKMTLFLANWENHSNYEVQERALSWLEFLKLCLEASHVSETTIKKLQNDEVEYYQVERKKRLHDHSDDDESEDDESDEEEESDEESDGDSSDEGDSAQNDHEDKINKVSGDTIKESSLDINLTNPFAEEDNKDVELPFLVRHVLPSFFKSHQLNPVSKTAQRNIAIPDDLNLDEPINPTPQLLPEDTDVNDAYNLYLSDDGGEANHEEDLLDLSEDTQQKMNERLERLQDDPYYITSSTTSNKNKKPKSKSSEKEQTASISDANGEQDSIASISQLREGKKKKPRSKKLKKEKVVILSEETIGDDSEPATIPTPVAEYHKKKNKLKIDSSNLDNFDLTSTVSDPISSDTKEYDIDLDALRKKLAEELSAEAGKDKKKKKKKTLSGEVKKKKSKLSEIKTTTDNVEPVPGSSPAPAENAKDETKEVPGKVIAVKKTKKAKKKAAIIE
mgnify:CR=1 FL=1